MCTTGIYGLPLTPAAIADEKGTTVVVQQAASPLWLEKILRSACSEMGGSVGLATRPQTAGRFLFPASFFSKRTRWNRCDVCRKEGAEFILFWYSNASST